jgi:hypothetical protein
VAENLAVEIYVDVDACPVKDEVLRVAGRHGLRVYMVGNSWLRHGGDNPLINRVVVAQDLDAADDWIAEHIGAGDIAVTADIPLAARCLDKGAHALDNTGKPFTPENIGNALAMRELKSHLRETDEGGYYNPSFTKRDRSQFLQALENTVQALRRS